VVLTVLSFVINDLGSI